MRLAILGQRQRIDFQEFQILLPGDLRQARGVAGKAGGEVGREQLAEARQKSFPAWSARRVRSECAQALPMLRRSRHLRAPAVAPAAARCRRCGPRRIFRARSATASSSNSGVSASSSAGHDQPAGVAKIARLVEAAHQAALAAAAFEELRLEHEARAIVRLHRASFRRHEAIRCAARRCRGGATRLFRRTRQDA